MVTRAKYEGLGERARKVMLAMPKEDLEDLNKMDKVLKSKGIKIDRRWAGRIRSKVLGTNSHSNNGKEPDSLARVNTVLKILPSVGGIEGLEATVALIKKIKEKV